MNSSSKLRICESVLSDNPDFFWFVFRCLSVPLTDIQVFYQFFKMIVLELKLELEFAVL